MKKLENLSVTALSTIVFVQFLRDTVTDIEGTQVGLLSSDKPLEAYLKKLKEGIDPYEAALRNPQKNPYTDQLLEKDKTRDNALNRFGWKLRYYGLTEDKDEKQAFTTLNLVWKVHRNNASLNQSAQTSATDNLLNDLTKEPYASAVNQLDLQAEIDAVKRTNDDFRSLADDKRAEKAGKEYSDSKLMRHSLSETYNAITGYVLALANAYPDNAEWSKLLAAINVTRKSY